MFITKLHFSVFCLELQVPPPFAGGLRWTHTGGWMQLETVLVELPTDWEQRPVEGQGEGGKGKGTSTAAFRKADTTGTQRAGRPEPTVKAQGEFGTN